jgi:hypothetical protein
MARLPVGIGRFPLPYESPLPVMPVVSDSTPAFPVRKPLAPGAVADAWILSSSGSVIP